MDVKAIQAFTEQPEKYVLQYKNSEVSLLKRNVWTWITIHIGSFLGLFDRSTVTLANISQPIFRELSSSTLDPELLQKFYESVDYCILRWNYTHESKLPTKSASYRKTEFSTTLKSWLQETEMEVSKAAIALLEKMNPKGVVTGVFAAKYGDALFVRFDLTPIPHSFHSPKKSLPNLDKLFSSFIQGSSEGVTEWQKAQTIAHAIQLKISPNPDNTCQVEIALL